MLVGEKRLAGGLSCIRREKGVGRRTQDRVIAIVYERLWLGRLPHAMGCVPPLRPAVHVRVIMANRMTRALQNAHMV